MESRKYQLKQQIIEAIKASDSDLFSLLKSQWAHRYGVESLEELENLDLTILNQKTTNEDNKKNDQLKTSIILRLRDDEAQSHQYDRSRKCDYQCET